MAFIQIQVSQTYHSVMQATFEEKKTPQEMQRGDGEAKGVTQQIINNG